MKIIFLRIVLLLSFLVITCTLPVSQGGGGSEVEVVGYVYFPGNSPAPSTQVKLITVDYNAATMEEIADSMIDTSDTQGRYSFKNVSPGTYNVQAVQLTQRTMMLVRGVEVSGNTTIVPSDSLQVPGTIRLLLQDTVFNKGIITIPGTDIKKVIAGGSNEIVMDSVPAGIIPEIRYTFEGDTSTRSLTNIKVHQSETTTLTDPSWKYQQYLLLNTTSSGADIQKTQYNFPVLIRLNNDKFDFTTSQTGGEDIRFSSSNGTPLAFEIEHWDATNGYAAIWVIVDTVFGSNSTQSIIMYWGNTAAKNSSNSVAVFDTAKGYQGVWHMGDAIDGLFHDATANKYHGISPDTAQPSSSKGYIGKCCTFDGTSDFITVPNTADSKLNFPECGNYTVSAWVFMDTLDRKSHCIVSKGYEQYFLRQTSISPGLTYAQPLWEFVEYNEKETWQPVNGPASSKEWTFLVGIRHGTQEFLYCNGILVDSTIDTWDNLISSRKTTFDLNIGRFAETITNPNPEGYCYFKGGIDEVRIISAAQDPDWIKLCYMNQRSDDRLVVFQNPESLRPRQ